LKLRKISKKNRNTLITQTRNRIKVRKKTMMNLIKKVKYLLKLTKIDTKFTIKMLSLISINLFKKTFLVLKIKLNNRRKGNSDFLH